jgi:nicotinamide mononucleotide (NMN) deamidase PncC
MAQRAREIFGATWAMGTTGVAGPTTQEGKPVGTVFVAVDGPRSAVVQLALSGDRQQVRETTCRRALELLHRLLE